MQRRIQNHVKHLRWNALRKLLKCYILDVWHGSAYASNTKFWFSEWTETSRIFDDNEKGTITSIIGFIISNDWPISISYLHVFLKRVNYWKAINSFLLVINPYKNPFESFRKIQLLGDLGQSETTGQSETFHFSLTISLSVWIDNLDFGQYFAHTLSTHVHNGRL